VGLFLPIRSAESSLRVLQSGKLANKKAHAKKHGPLVCWLPIVDEFRNFLMSEEADFITEQLRDF
jgi:hypothetical protein